MKSFYPTTVRSLIFILPILVFSNLAFAQSVIKGVITGSDGTPLPGATASIKGTGTFAVADVNGEFRLVVGITPGVVVVHGG